jgi:hypothetical protein
MKAISSIQTTQMVKPNFDNIVAVVCGLVGGLVKFSRVFLLETYWVSLLKAGGTAVVCGLCGLFGKYLFNLVRKQWLEREKPAHGGRHHRHAKKPRL